MRSVGFAAVLVAGAALAACSGGDSDTGSADAASACAPTVANGSAPPGEAASERHHGNGRLWTVLWPGGVVRPDPAWVQADGSIRVKFPWWRGVEGALAISGRRLDGDAPPLVAEIPAGYGTIGFQATSIVFGTPGCWSVTGRVATTSLTFVVDVRRG
jgi:hypothetical protein